MSASLPSSIEVRVTTARYDSFSVPKTSSEGNAIVFGDLTVARYGPNATSNQVRGIFAGGGGGNPYPYMNISNFFWGGV